MLKPFAMHRSKVARSSPFNTSRELKLLCSASAKNVRFPFNSNTKDCLLALSACHLALSLSTTLGQIDGIYSALKTLSIGIMFALVISILLGLFYPTISLTPEILSRTSVGLDGLALALASGAAAALSITTGVSSVLVGVMVAVALLPPTVALGICIGLEAFNEAKGAALLLIANIASVNLTAQLTMRLKDIKPREEDKQTTATLIFSVGLIFWCLLIGYLIYRLYS